ncbi:MAG TPA: hypothetical protein VG142_10435 [Trebonia sp.]|nr:hypothetical protein [Trebonia sp.]
MYKRQIGAASVAFVAAGVLAAGTAYASTNAANSALLAVARSGVIPVTVTGAAPARAVVSSLPSINQTRRTAANDVTLAARGLAPAARGLARHVTRDSVVVAKGVSAPLRLASPLTQISSAVPGASVASGAAKLPGVAAAGNSVEGAAGSRTIVQSLARTVRASRILGKAKSSGSGRRGLLPKVAAPLAPVSGNVAGVTELLDGSAGSGGPILGGLTVAGIPLG